MRERERGSVTEQTKKLVRPLESLSVSVTYKELRIILLLYVDRIRLKLQNEISFSVFCMN